MIGFGSNIKGTQITEISKINNCMESCDVFPI